MNLLKRTCSKIILMKKILSEKGLAFFLVFIAFLISGYLYQQGKISFLPKKNTIPELENIIAEIPFTDKEYKLTLSERPLTLVEEIAKFEDLEKWIGDGEFDYSDYIEGKSSLALSSQGHSKSTATLELKKSFNFKNYLKYKFFVNLRSEPANTEDLVLIFSDINSKEAFRYPIRDLQRGWNFLSVPQKDFSIVLPVRGGDNEGNLNKEVKKVTFELVSRPKTAAAINLDFMWGGQDIDYLKDWNVDSEKFISLGKNDSSIGFLINGLVGSVASLRTISSAKDYSISAKFIALRPGFFGLYLRSNYKDGRGYYLGMDGIDSGSWQIYKIGTFEGKQQQITLAKGIIENFELEKGRPYWLKADLKGDRISFLLSSDGKKYNNIGEANDSSFPSGGVGIVAVNSMYLVDDFQFSQ